jgi:hypothetical protein
MEEVQNNGSHSIAMIHCTNINADILYSEDSYSIGNIGIGGALVIGKRFGKLSCKVEERESSPPSHLNMSN